MMHFVSRIFETDPEFKSKMVNEIRQGRVMAMEASPLPSLSRLIATSPITFKMFENTLDTHRLYKSKENIRGVSELSIFVY